jgi:hypothetical protein
MPAQRTPGTRCAIERVACPAQGCETPQGTPCRRLGGGEQTSARITTRTRPGLTQQRKAERPLYLLDACRGREC